MRKEIQEFHNQIVKGLVNGLSHTHQDGRLKDIVFWQKRCELFNLFGLCVMRLETNQNYEEYLDELKDMAKEGYKK